ncbi:hypothetical protein ACOI1C_07055 [Bacillus sp. DJP31]|uniref:pyroglutamyl-peptidase I family protein n=1 Tax=Bacillus sp. DJP31 TaxID=3409789 RepID=UPI003BB62353
MKRLLLMGFVPFLDFKLNPTKGIARVLDGRALGNYEVYGRVLPVEFNRTQ